MGSCPQVSRCPGCNIKFPQVHQEGCPTATHYSEMYMNKRRIQQTLTTPELPSKLKPKRCAVCGENHPLRECATVYPCPSCGVKFRHDEDSRCVSRKSYDSMWKAIMDRMRERDQQRDASERGYSSSEDEGAYSGTKRWYETPPTIPVKDQKYSSYASNEPSEEICGEEYSQEYHSTGKLQNHPILGWPNKVIKDALGYIPSRRDILGREEQWRYRISTQYDLDRKERKQVEKEEDQLIKTEPTIKIEMGEKLLEKIQLFEEMSERIAQIGQHHQDSQTEPHRYEVKQTTDGWTHTGNRSAEMHESNEQSQKIQNNDWEAPYSEKVLKRDSLEAYISSIYNTPIDQRRAQRLEPHREQVEPPIYDVPIIQKRTQPRDSAYEQREQCKYVNPLDHGRISGKTPVNETHRQETPDLPGRTPNYPPQGNTERDQNYDQPPDHRRDIEQDPQWAQPYPYGETGRLQTPYLSHTDHQGSMGPVDDLSRTLGQVLQTQEQNQAHTTQALWEVSQSMKDRSKERWIKDLPTFNGQTKDGYFDWLLKIETLARLANYSPSELALGAAEGSVLKTLNTLLAEGKNWEQIKRRLQRQFSHTPTVSHASTRLLQIVQASGQTLQSFIYEFSHLLRMTIDREPKQIVDKNYQAIFMKALMNPSLQSKMIRKNHTNLEECFHYALKVEADLLLVEGLHADPSTIKAIQPYTGGTNNPSYQPYVGRTQNPPPNPETTNLTCWICGGSGHFRDACPRNVTNPGDKQKVTHSFTTEGDISSTILTKLLFELARGSREHNSEVPRRQLNANRKQPRSTPNKELTPRTVTTTPSVKGGENYTRKRQEDRGSSSRKVTFQEPPPKEGGRTGNWSKTKPSRPNGFKKGYEEAVTPKKHLKEPTLGPNVTVTPRKTLRQNMYAGEAAIQWEEESEEDDPEESEPECLETDEENLSSLEEYTFNSESDST